VKAALSALGLAFASSVAAQTTIDHQQIAYFVPEKRVNIAANVSDPKGVKVARTYFKAGAQADYTFVPMQPAGGNRYVATLPAPSANTPSIEYIVLAQNTEGAVARTDAYTVAARKSNETPAWQSGASQGDVKVYTELAEAPRTVAGFTDSITIDIAESGARLGAVAGLHGAGSGGAAAGTSATASTVGGLSTMAIVGGVVAAGALAAAAGGGGGGGGGGGTTAGGTTGGGTTPGSFSGNWSGTRTTSISATCSGTSVSCNATQPFSGTVNSSNQFNGTVGNVQVSCSSPAFDPIAQSVAAAGPLTMQLDSSGRSPIPAVNQTQSGVTVTCPASTINFSTSPRSISGTQQCQAQYPGCSFGFSFSYTGG